MAILGHGGQGDAAATPAAATPAAVSARAKNTFAKSVGGRAGATKLAAQTCPTPDSSVSKPLPAGFPKGLPLPKGTVLTTVRTYHPRGFPKTIIVQGYVPRSLRSAVQFFLTELPRHGYRMGRGDSELGEAEAQLQGHGFRGAWKVGNLSVPCPNIVSVLVGVSPTM